MIRRAKLFFSPFLLVFQRKISDDNENEMMECLIDVVLCLMCTPYALFFLFFPFCFSKADRTTFKNFLAKPTCLGCHNVNKVGRLGMKWRRDKITQWNEPRGFFKTRDSLGPPVQTNTFSIGDDILFFSSLYIPSFFLLTWKIS